MMTIADETPRRWYGRFERAKRFFTYSFVLSPEHWAVSSPPVSLRWKSIPFSRSKRPPRTTKGVYSFVIRPLVDSQPAGEYVVYIGKVGSPDNARSFRDRHSEYLRERETDDPERIQIALDLEALGDSVWFYYATVSDAAKIDSCEKALIRCLQPPWNSTGKAIPQGGEPL